MTPRVSVVIANYNYGRYIGAALASVRAQTMTDFHAVIVDDGSTDNSLAVIEPFLADPRFKLIRLAHHGQSRAKNRAVQHATAPLIGCLDADDVWHPTKLERQLELFERLPHLGVVFTRRRFIDPDGRETGFDRRPYFRGRVLNEMFRDNFVCYSSALVRREVFDHVGLFDEALTLAVDYDLWLRVARHYAFDYVDEPLVAYRTGHANLSRRVTERLRTALFIMKRFRDVYDRPAELEPRATVRAFAETYRHLGLFNRPTPRIALAWSFRSLVVRPFDRVTWRMLLGSFAPLKLRQFLRRLRGAPEWERTAGFIPAGGTTAGINPAARHGSA